MRVPSVEKPVKILVGWSSSACVYWKMIPLHMNGSFYKQLEISGLIWFMQILGMSWDWLERIRSDLSFPQRLFCKPLSQRISIVLRKQNSASKGFQ